VAPSCGFPKLFNMPHGGRVAKSTRRAAVGSCFAEPPSGEWKGPRTVHTPLVTSVNGELRAYAVIEARAAGPC